MISMSVPSFSGLEKAAALTVFLSICSCLHTIGVRSQPTAVQGHNLLEADGIAIQPDPCDTAGTWNDATPYVRIAFDNDFFKLRGTTDRYYTNGEKVEVFLPPKASCWMRPLFIQLKESPTRNNNFGIGLGMAMYTPTDIERTHIEPRDRPYAGWAGISLKCVSTEFTTGERFTSEYTLGAIGPVVRQKQIQTWWHEVIDSPKPLGWDHQVANDLALNVYALYEHVVTSPSAHFQITTGGEINVGTVTNFAGWTSQFRWGLYNDQFLNEGGLRSGQNKVKRYSKTCKSRIVRRHYQQNMDRKCQAYFFVRPTVRAVMDNALLQGGLFSYRDCPFTIPADELQRAYVQNEVGLVIVYRGIGVALSQVSRGREFRYAQNAQWGSIQLLFKLA